MKFVELLPSWAKPVFREAGLELNFEETKMNCSSCTFAVGDSRDESKFNETYLESLKCCTFFPDLPNFAAGFELRKNPAAFDHLIANESEALPLGILAPDTYKAEYSKSEFGQQANLLCPHFDRTNLNCSIWESRPSSCVRFVCKSSLQGLGQKIWARTESALYSLEANLAYEAALQLGFVNYEIHAKRWSVGPEEKKAFYTAAATFVDALTEQEKIELAGEEFASARSQIQSLALGAAL